MGKQKTRKAVSKRIRITKTGKMLHRKQGQDHFNAKESGNTSRKKRSRLEINNKSKKTLKKELPYS